MSIEFNKNIIPSVFIFVFHWTFLAIHSLIVVRKIMNWKKCLNEP